MNKITVKQKVSTELPTEYGIFTIYGYQGTDSKEHVVLVKGDIKSQNMLCRVHSECITGEVFGSLKCDCKEQLEIAFMLIEQEQNGMIIYLRQEGRGIGLIEKLKAYKLQNKGRDTLDANLELGHQADARDYGIAAQILHDLQVQSIRMITNNPDKISQLESHGIKILERIPVIATRINEHNKSYLKIKAERMHHILKED